MKNKKEYDISNEKGQTVLSFFWYNDASSQEVSLKINNYLYENLIHLLLLIRDVDKITDSNEKIDTTSFIEENLMYLDESIILEIGNENIENLLISKIETCLKEYYINKADMDWAQLSLQAQKILDQLKIDRNLTAEKYAENHLDLDFLFQK